MSFLQRKGLVLDRETSDYSLHLPRCKEQGSSAKATDPSCNIPPRSDPLFGNLQVLSSPAHPDVQVR